MNGGVAAGAAAGVQLMALMVSKFGPKTKNCCGGGAAGC